MTALRLPTASMDDFAPLVPGLSEATLFRGLGAPVEPVTKACACGLAITSLSGFDADIALAVAAHNRMPEHLDYRDRMGTR